MNCSDFVARFTDYRDRTAPSSELAVMEEHLRRCASCRRYETVVERGAALLRSLPPLEVGEDFVPRLERRLHRIQEELAAEPVASRTPAAAVFAVAAILTAAAWFPLLRGRTPVVELAPIVVDRAPRELRAVRLAGVGQQPELRLRGQPELDAGLWEDARLYEYSALSRRYDRTPQARQVGLVSGR
jgi:anti-sigma factor RsiW